MKEREWGSVGAQRGNGCFLRSVNPMHLRPQNRWADPETREFDVKKDKMDSSAYRLASFNIADNTDVKVLD